MDTIEAIKRKQEAVLQGRRGKVFDWDKAAAYIRDHRSEIEWVNAGLREDMEWTSGTIWADDSPEEVESFLDIPTYLESVWATPIMQILFKDVGIQELECWRYSDEVEWNAYTFWPESALAILSGEDLNGKDKSNGADDIYERRHKRVNKIETESGQRSAEDGGRAP